MRTQKAAYSVATWHPSHLEMIHQEVTGVLPEFRRRDFAKKIKAALLNYSICNIPEFQYIKTSNAIGKESIFQINDALGFKLAATKTRWRMNLDAVFEYLRHRAIE